MDGEVTADDVREPLWAVSYLALEAVKAVRREGVEAAEDYLDRIAAQLAAARAMYSAVKE